MFPCVDCRYETLDYCCWTGEYYLVTAAVWRAAGMRMADRVGGGHLCVDCLERRLGRELEPEDFPDDGLVNTLGWWNTSPKLRALLLPRERPAKARTGAQGTRVPTRPGG